MGRATCFFVVSVFDFCHFNPRPPWGGRHSRTLPFKNSIVISIHALRGEGDPSHSKAHNQRGYFNPRPPWGGRRKLGRELRAMKKISIHALRGEGDTHRRKVFNILLISIHALRGEGDEERQSPKNSLHHFNPRPPWGGRHRELDGDLRDKDISIHALRGEGD